MKDFESWMLSYLLNSLWQVPLLLAAGWVASRALRRVGAEAEHRVWVCVLVLQVALPASYLLAEGWLPAMGWVRAMLGSGATRPNAEVTVLMGAGVGAASFPLPPAYLIAIVVAYGMTTVVFAARFVRRWMRLVKMRRDASALVLTGKAALSWENYATRFGVDQVTLATSSRIFGPVTLGVLRKLVLLPEKMATDLPTKELEAVIAHEFAHIQRNDFVKNLIYEFLSLPVSYHPLFWLTRERIMETREMVCDQMAAGCEGQKEYAKTLLRLASLLVKEAPFRSPHAIGIFDAHTFERRVMRLTGKRQNLFGIKRLAMLAWSAAFGVAVCAAVMAMSMRVDAQSSESGSKAPSSVHVSAGVMAGNLVHKVNPVYPVEAKKAKIQGTVVLRAVVGKDGTVENLSVESGPKELQQSALDAVRQWTYKPFLLNGDPVEVDTTINVIYTLAG